MRASHLTDRFRCDLGVPPKTAAAPGDGFWGGRIYAAKDLEGHQWEFSQRGRDLAAHLWQLSPGVTWA
jgi:hypothetical protein